MLSSIEMSILRCCAPYPSSRGPRTSRCHETLNISFQFGASVEDGMLHMWPKTWQAILDRLREKISFIICVRCSVAVSSKSWRSIRAYATTATFGSTSVSHTFKMPLDFPVRIPLYNPSTISNGTSSKDSVWSPIASVRSSLQLSSSSPL